MANEIDRYLLKKLARGVSEIEDHNLQGRFKYLVGLLEKKAQQDSSCKDLIIRDKLYQLNDVLSDYRAQSGMESDEGIALCLDAIGMDLKHQNESASPEDAGALGQSTNVQDFFHQPQEEEGVPSRVYGLEKEISILESSLLREAPFKAIGMVGPTGIGKTTLCRLLFNSEQVRRYFVPKILVSKSRQPNQGINRDVEILLAMMVQLGVDSTITEEYLSERGKTGLLILLHQQLLGKRYLIILDDVCGDKEWYDDLDGEVSVVDEWGDHFADGLPKGQGGTIIVTSRSEEKARAMVGAENLHQMSPLQNDDHLWQIFMDEVEMNEHLMDNVLKLRKEIRLKCGGLPLGAKLMGRRLKEKQSKVSVSEDNSQPGSAAT